MPRKWVPFQPLLALGAGGEESDAAPARTGVSSGYTLRYPKVRRAQNVRITGPGVLEQIPDWLLGDTLKNTTPVENHAVCGTYPFVQQGGASAASAGVAFSFNATDDKIYLHQIGEGANVLRSFTAYSSFTNALPPQVIGVEMFGVFYFVEYGQESTATRKGLAFFDPTTTGSITLNTYALNGGTPAALRFRGISVHRGATLLGWGYQDEVTPIGDDWIRWCAYGDPTTWVPDTNPANEQTAGGLPVGTLGIPIIACAMSDQFTIIGKAQEVFALDGDWSATFATRQIGANWGPVSTAGMVSIGRAAVWMSSFGPAVSDQGGAVTLLGIDQIQRKYLANYFDLENSWAAHDPNTARVVWALRRKIDDSGNVVSSPYKTELCCWDYQRNEFTTQSLPAPVFCVGSIRGPGLSLVGPTGTVSTIVESNTQPTSATISWTPGDTSSDVTFLVQYRSHGSSAWITGGTTAPAVATFGLTGLAPMTLYDVQIAQIRNGQTSAFTMSLALFTTLNATAVQDPTSVMLTETGATQTKAGVTYSQIVCQWSSFSVPNSVVKLYRADVNDVTKASWTGGAGAPSGFKGGAAFCYDPNYQPLHVNVYYWVRNEATDGSGAVSDYVQATPAPLAPTGRPPAA